MKLTADQVRWLRLHAQRLISGPPATGEPPEAILVAVAGLQAQDLPSARLGLRVRSRELTDAGVQQACQQPDRLALTWTLRGTLHLHSAADAAWLVPLFGPGAIAGDKRRMRQLGWDEANTVRGLDLLRKGLAEAAELTRPEIIRMLAQAGLPSEGQAPIHLIYRAACEGWLCYGPLREGQQTFVQVEDWIGELQPLPRQQAMGRLANRYLAAYGPATREDFASWAKLRAVDIRQGWGQLEGEIVELEAFGRPVWLLKSQLAHLDGMPELAQEPVARLLPRFDAILLGYASRDWLLDPAYARQVHPGGGMIRASLLVDGRLCGTWKSRALKSGLRVEVTPFEPLPENVLPPLEADVADLGRFLGQKGVLALVSE